MRKRKSKREKRKKNGEKKERKKMRMYQVELSPQRIHHDIYVEMGCGIEIGN